MSPMYNISIFLAIVLFQPFVQGRGFFVLYRPRDLTNDCLNSQKLRYDLSFGMGMSDTITLVFRTIPDVDYECEVDVNTDGLQLVYAVIRYPNAIGYNCEMNFQAFHVMQKNECLPVCELLEDTNLFSRYWIIIKKGRFRFQYRSNSSVDADMDAYLYEVTVTTVRKRLKGQKCVQSNETECYDNRYDEYYCMTNGILCDGIQNCGVQDWYDERKSECERPTQQLGYPPIFTVVAIIMCFILAASHILQRCLPQATSFFIFNTNGDNRLIIDPVFRRPAESVFENYENLERKKSVIPIDLFSSSDSESEEVKEQELKTQDLQKTMDIESKRKKESITMKLMSKMIQRRLRSVVGIPLNVLNYVTSEDQHEASTRHSTNRHK